MKLLSLLVPAPSGVDPRTLRMVQLQYDGGDVFQFYANGRDLEVQEVRVSAPVEIASLGRVV